MIDLTQWKVVLVDDDPDSLNLMHDIFALRGAEVYHATDGEQGLALMEKVTPKLIVMDLAMPKLDGWALLMRVRANPRLASVPVVAVTAYYSANVADQALQAGFDAFVPKPIKATVLMEQLERLAK